MSWLPALRDVLRDWLTPEAQMAPHHWAATFGGHVALGVGGWSLAGPFRPETVSAVYLVAALYWLGWEWPLSCLRRPAWSSLADSLLDWSAVTLGATLAGALWANDTRTALATLAACAAIVVAGTLIRTKYGAKSVQAD